MMTTGPGSLPNVAAYDQQNVLRLKNLGTAFNNLGYQNQLGTKQLERLARTMSSLPQPAAPVVQASWTPPPVQPVSDRAGFVKQGTGLSMNWNTTPTWKADPFKAITAKTPTFQPKALGRALGATRGGGGGGGGGGMPGTGAPMQSNLSDPATKFGQPTGANPSGGGVITDAEMSARMGKSGGTPSTALPATSPGTLGVSAKEGAGLAGTNHAAYAAKGPTLAQRQQGQLAALDTNSGVSYGQTANPMGSKTAELEAKGDARRAKDAASIKGLNKGKGKGKGK